MPERQIGGYGFTLVELIIVITILAILATIAFLSFKGYMKDARDGNRVASISNIEKGLGIFNLQTSKYPTPDKKDGQTLLQTGALSISGSIIEYSYLGEVGSGLTQQLKIGKIPQDPLSSNKYSYTTTLDGRKYQIASILENPTSYKNNLVKQANAGNDGYVAKVSGNHQDIVIKEFGTGKYITVVPSLVFDPSGSNVLNQSGTLSIVNNKGNLPYSPSNGSNIGNTTTAEQLIKEIRNNPLATTATLKLPSGVTLDGSGVLNGYWIPNVGNTNWNGYSSGEILASLGAVGVNGGADYTKLTDVLNGGSSSNISAPSLVTSTPTTPSYNVGNSLMFNGTSSNYLSRTFTGAGNEQKFTISTWVKFSRSSVCEPIFSSAIDIQNRFMLFHNCAGNGELGIQTRIASTYYELYTSAVYRDPSTWYNIVLSVDTNQLIDSERIKLYVNGTQVTSFTSAYGAPTYPPRYSDIFWNRATSNHGIGYVSTNSWYFDGYISDFNSVDSGALSPTSFGQFDSNGRWVPIQYTGSYGTNGFHLDFSSGSNLGYDSSGNGKDWQVNGSINQASNQMIDSPTNNFATLNPLIVPYIKPTLTSGNLLVAGTSGIGGTFNLNTGKWYWEVAQMTTTAGFFGIYGPQDGMAFQYNYNNANSIIYDAYSSRLWVNGSVNVTSLSGGLQNAVFGVALDCDNHTVSFYKNGGLIITKSSIASQDWTPGSDGSAGTTSLFNFGQGGQSNLNYDSNAGGYFKYTPTSLGLTGYKALSTKNIDYPIENPKQYFDVLTWTGDAASIRSITGLTFQPDLVWLKSRNASYDHWLYDTVRLAGKALTSDNTQIESSGAYNGFDSGRLSSFDSGGFGVVKGTTGGSYTNESGKTYIAWNWKKGTTSGFDIVTYTANPSGLTTINHNLGNEPAMIITKSTNMSNNWIIYHKSLGKDKYLSFTTNGSNPDTNVWNNTTPGTGSFLQASGWWGGSSPQMLAYLWSEVPGYSKFGSYTGNGSATGDGPFVYTGFKPRYIMIKSINNSGQWRIFDTVRNTINPASNVLFAGDTSDESTASSGAYGIDILSNGFKLKNNGTDTNGLNWTYIYTAFAELPFK